MALAGSRTDESEDTRINYRLRDMLRRFLNALYNFIWAFACRTFNKKMLKVLWKPASFIFPVTERVENSRYADVIDPNTDSLQLKQVPLPLPPLGRKCMEYGVGSTS